MFIVVLIWLSPRMSITVRGYSPRDKERCNSLPQVVKPDVAETRLLEQLLELPQEVMRVESCSSSRGANVDPTPCYSSFTRRGGASQSCSSTSPPTPASAGFLADDVALALLISALDGSIFAAGALAD